MNPERWRQVREVFDAVCETEDAGERRTILDAMCGEDAELRREVLTLLAAEDAAPAGLDTPGAGLLGALLVADPAGAGSVVGPYRLVRHIATGGMGSVYLGQRADEQFQLTVAVKIVRRGLADDESLHRFRRERQTLATLNHPYIARLLDGGVTEAGAPYLVMEYIEGLPIDAFCDEHQLSIPDRLSLFLRVCSAVEHAHHNLIIHRDLKPGNIFITSDGDPKLLDFGIAKVLETRPPDAASPPLTQQRIMTPLYASPEQIRGEPMTTASDVYSLGVVLYELLTGRRPHVPTTRALHEIERAICEDEPERPSIAVARAESAEAAPDSDSSAAEGETIGQRRGLDLQRLRRRLRGDLDAIVMMALQKRPRDRYASVEQLANDIRNHLEGSPIAARRISTVHRWWKHVRRYRVVMAAVLIVIASLLGGIIGISRARSREMLAAQQAIAEAENASVEVDKSRSVILFLKNVLAAGSPADLGPDVSIRTVLDRSSKIVKEEFGEDPEVESAVRTSIAETYVALGDFGEAEPHLREALRLQIDIHRGDHPDVARSQRNLCRLLYEMHNLDEARLVCGEALDMSRRLYAGPHEDLATDLNNLGAIHRSLGQLDDAERLLSEALAMRRALPGERDVEIAETLTNLGNLHRVRGEWGPAESMVREALQLRRARLAPDHPLVVQALHNLSVVLASQRQYDEAAASMTELLDTARGRLGPDHPDLGHYLNTLGSIYFMQQKFDAAEPVIRDCVRVRELNFGPQDKSTITSRITWGRCLAQLGRYEEAEKVTLQAVEAARQVEDTDLMSRAASAAGLLYTLWEKPDKAAEFQAMIPQAPVAPAP
jgi:serine/threonine-protein kinase